MFSISESGWWMIAVVATGFFMIAVPALAGGMKYQDDPRRTPEQQARQRKWMFYLGGPVLFAALLGANLLRPGPASPILFMYSVVIVSVPIAIAPVRGRLIKQSLAQQQNPGTKVKLDRLTAVWIYGFLSVVMLGVVVAVMAATYGK
ncbi:hypothetical protein [Streptomyces sp. NBC_01236]|uniref:hypothetical protein n=1 Tax=Streptomyces sp. NBC_01236 TaxID=2903789 RepID=UPI002E0ECEBB|nr:hypothetical protein OG324_19210 [Streptomyces sp. NBC_01236]